MRVWGLVFIVSGLLFLVLASGLEEDASSGHAVVNSSLENVSVNVSVGESSVNSSVSGGSVTSPDCVVELDCGLSGYSELNCSRDFVVKYYYNYTCSHAGTFQAKCVNTTIVEPLAWCNPIYEECSEGRMECQPKKTCNDGIINCHDGACEEDVDCGGSCEPCSTCYDNIQNCHGGKCETGVDCGGPCPSCEIGCARSSDCGIDRFSEEYCGRDGSVYRDFYTYKCVRPGLYGSWCKPIKVEIDLVDYCGPLSKCIDGECIDMNAPAWRNITYIEERQPGKVGDFCLGDKCFKLRIFENETAE